MITRIPLKLALTLEPEELLEYERLLGLAEGPQKGVYARVPSEDYNRYFSAKFGTAARWRLFHLRLVTSTLLLFPCEQCLCVRVPRHDD